MQLFVGPTPPELRSLGLILLLLLLLLVPFPVGAVIGMDLTFVSFPTSSSDPFPALSLLIVLLLLGLEDDFWW